MAIRIGETWSSIRGVLRNYFSFAEIKDLVGGAGLQIDKLAHLQQKSRGGTSKGQLMDAIDGLVSELDINVRDRFVTACIGDIVKENPGARIDLEAPLNRVGWRVSEEGPYPLVLQIDLETAELSKEVRDGVVKCLTRYRNGDFDGAMTAICGVVDRLTEEIYKSQTIGNPHLDSYQQRVNRAFNALERAYKGPLYGIPVDGINRLWHNHKGAINQAAYVLGAFRREYSDVHGARNAQPQLVQRAIDCAVFIVRSIAD